MIPLSGTNTYGGTNVVAGSLQVFSSQATGTAGAVELANRTTLHVSTSVYSYPDGGLSLGSLSNLVLSPPTRPHSSVGLI